MLSKHCLDVTFEHPVVLAAAEVVNLRERVVPAPVRAEPARAVPKILLEDGLKDQFRCCKVIQRLVAHYPRCSANSTSKARLSTRWVNWGQQTSRPSSWV